MSDGFRGETIGFDEFSWGSITVEQIAKIQSVTRLSCVFYTFITSAIIFAPWN